MQPVFFNSCTHFHFIFIRACIWSRYALSVHLWVYNTRLQMSSPIVLVQLHMSATSLVGMHGYMGGHGAVGMCLQCVDSSRGAVMLLRVQTYTLDVSNVCLTGIHHASMIHKIVRAQPPAAR